MKDEEVERGKMQGWLRQDESREEKEKREEKERLKGLKTLVVVGTYSIGKERIVKGEVSDLVTIIPTATSELTLSFFFFFFFFFIFHTVLSHSTSSLSLNLYTRISSTCGSFFLLISSVLISFPVGIAQALSTKIYADQRKRALIDDQSSEDPEIQPLMTLHPSESQVHMIPLRDISLEGLAAYLKRYQKDYDRILGFRPTGWT